MSKELERAAEYRRLAAELLEASVRQIDERQRATLLDVAGLYHRMAEQLEEIHALDIEPNTRTKDEGTT